MFLKIREYNETTHETITDLFYKLSVMNENMINNLFQKDVILEMMDPTSIEEI